MTSSDDRNGHPGDLIAPVSNNRYNVRYRLQPNIGEGEILGAPPSFICHDGWVLVDREERRWAVGWMSTDLTDSDHYGDVWRPIWCRKAD